MNQQVGKTITWLLRHGAVEENVPIKVQERQGMYLKTASVNDKYAARPKGINDLTLSQFATSYTKCKKKPKVTFNKDGVTDKTGNIIDHLTGFASMNPSHHSFQDLA